MRPESNKEYTVRVDGKPIGFYSSMCTDAITQWVNACKENPKSYVDIARISTDILVSQYDFGLLNKFFSCEFDER